MNPERIAEFRFYEELNDFLPKKHRKKSFIYHFRYNQSVKDAIEALGVPHAEVDLILVNGNPVDFNYTLKNGDRVSVYPVFESLDISEVTLLRHKPLREPRFILDVHLGKLCKYLRMLGFDTFYKNNLDDHDIIRIASDEKRIILTRDVGILKNGNVSHGYWIRSQNSRKQLSEVLQRFDLYKLIRPFYRCVVCNGLVDEIEKQQVYLQLPENTRKHYQNFYHCTSCGKIYWEGSHYANMQAFVNEILQQRPDLMNQ